MTREMVVKCFKDPPVLSTERLYFRKMLKRDYKDMFEYASNPQVTRFLLWEPHVDSQYTLRYLTYLQSRYKAGEFYDWALVETSSGKMIGTCGFTKFDFTSNCAEIGYVLNPLFWRHGYATEAVREIIKFGFIKLGLNRIEARFICGNQNSLSVMQKAGMKFEGIFRDVLYVKGKYVSVGVCSILSREYSSAR